MKGVRYYYVKDNMPGSKTTLTEKGFEELPGSNDGERIIVDALTKTYWIANDDDFDKCRHISIERDSMDIKEIDVKEIIEL